MLRQQSQQCTVSQPSVRKLGGTAIRSVGDISRRQRLMHNDADFVQSHEALA
ncbi:hypothetical protein FJ970_29255 [Mesorhizobium sp. B2-1-8]|nr:hypothetical protein [Mesorhizobium sp. B2-1-8]UCI19069.1 hypothetical protein FJ970_29255 [Mesorhizobium sp. B2-1-8]